MGKPGSKLDSTSKVDKKFAKKIQFYAKVRDTVASLSATKAIAKEPAPVLAIIFAPFIRIMEEAGRINPKRTIFLLSQNSSQTSELCKVEKDLPWQLNSKSREKLILREAEHLKAVLGHPAFKVDPFGALQQHLVNTQPVLN